MNKRKRIVSILAGVMAALMLLTLLLSILPAQANATSSSAIRKQINALEDEKDAIKEQMAEVQEQYEQNENELLDIIARKNVIDQEIGLLSSQILAINEQITHFNTLIADKQDELDDAEDRFDELNEANKDRIRTMEEEGELSYWEVLFKANSFSDLLDRLNMVEEIASSDQRRLKELTAASDAVEDAKGELELEKVDLEGAKQELDDAQAELDAKREEADALFQELMARADELEAMQEELAAEEEAFLAEIAELEVAYQEAKEAEWIAYMATMTYATEATSSGSPGNSSGTGNPGGTPSIPSSSGWRVPCSYTYVSSAFGYRESPTSGASTYHQGIDLAAPAGTPIYATRSGVVTTATYGNSAGYYVTINHMDGYASIYMHMTNYVVSAGQTVSQGQLIGYVGKTGVATGNHLHFGISYGGAYVNPANYIPV